MVKLHFQSLFGPLQSNCEENKSIKAKLQKIGHNADRDLEREENMDIRRICDQTQSNEKISRMLTSLDKPGFV
jgi:hypothetical protein